MNYIQRPKGEKRDSSAPAGCRMTALVALMCSTSKHAMKALDPGVMFCSESELQDLCIHLSHGSKGG